MRKATSLPPPPSPKDVPCVWKGTSVFETSFYGLQLVVVSRIYIFVSVDVEDQRIKFLTWALK